jgi:hypothetical protein
MTGGGAGLGANSATDSKWAGAGEWLVLHNCQKNHTANPNAKTLPATNASANVWPRRTTTGCTTTRG